MLDPKNQKKLEENILKAMNEAIEQGAERGRRSQLKELTGRSQHPRLILRPDSKQPEVFAHHL